MDESSNSNNNNNNNKVVTLNVGGRKYYTTIETLISTPNTMLSSMFSGKTLPTTLYDDEGNIFIDANPNAFFYVLEYLRRGKLYSPCIYSGVTMQEIATEMEYFGILNSEDHKINKQEKSLKLKESLSTKSWYIGLFKVVQFVKEECLKLMSGKLETAEILLEIEAYKTILVLPSCIACEASRNDEDGEDDERENRWRRTDKRSKLEKEAKTTYRNDIDVPLMKLMLNRLSNEKTTKVIKEYIEKDLSIKLEIEPISKYNAHISGIITINSNKKV